MATQETKSAATREHTLRIVEGYVRIVLATLVVLLIGYLIVAQPIMTNQAAMLTKALLAFALGALTASMAGSIKVSPKVPGIVVRAAGGFAVFAIAWFTLPKFVPGFDKAPQAALRIGSWTSADFRTFHDPSTPEASGGDTHIAITLALSAVADSQFTAARPASIEHAALHFQAGNLEERASWLWFVTHQHKQLPDSTWWSTTPRQDVGPVLVDASAPVSKEVMFVTSPGGMRWKYFVEEIRAGRCPKVLEVVWTVKHGDKQDRVRKVCNLACSGYSQRVEAFMKQQSRMPVTLNIPCNEGV